MVAIRKESVDRNIIFDRKKKSTVLSLSARRAWIETILKQVEFVPTLVALRKESVDRNTMTITICTVSKSLSARRAWIETSILMPIR